MEKEKSFVAQLMLREIFVWIKKYFFAFNKTYEGCLYKSCILSLKLRYLEQTLYKMKSEKINPISGIIIHLRQSLKNLIKIYAESI